jgi:hypothetical protein
MSSTLKSDILGAGTLEQRIFTAINWYGCAEGYEQSTDPCQAQKDFAQRLADAISEGVAKGVQKYLNETVKTITQPTLNSGGLVHVHENVPKFDLNAP